MGRDLDMKDLRIMMVNRLWEICGERLGDESTNELWEEDIVEKNCAVLFVLSLLRCRIFLCTTY